MRAVWKVNLHEVITTQGVDLPWIELPKGATVRSVQYQRGDLCLWAEVDPKAPLENRTVWIVGTGRPVPEPDQADYVSTVQDTSGLYVWHVYVSR